jgi:hypothetical protein
MPNHHEISLSYPDLQEMLEELQQEGANYRSQGCEISWTLQQPFGKWSNRSVHLRDDLDLSLTEWDVQETFQLMTDAPGKGKGGRLPLVCFLAWFYFILS